MLSLPRSLPVDAQSISSLELGLKPPNSHPQLSSLSLPPIGSHYPRENGGFWEIEAPGPVHQRYTVGTESFPAS